MNGAELYGRSTDGKHYGILSSRQAQTLMTVTSGVGLAGAVIALVPSLIVCLLLQRSLVTGIVAGATKR